MTPGSDVIALLAAMGMKWAQDEIARREAMRGKDEADSAVLARANQIPLVRRPRPR